MALNLPMTSLQGSQSKHVRYPDAASLSQAAVSETACIAMPHQDTALLLCIVQWMLELIKAAAAASYNDHRGRCISSELLWPEMVEIGRMCEFACKHSGCEMYDNNVNSPAVTSSAGCSAGQAMTLLTNVSFLLARPHKHRTE